MALADASRLQRLRTVGSSVKFRKSDNGWKVSLMVGKKRTKSPMRAHESIAVCSNAALMNSNVGILAEAELNLRNGRMSDHWQPDAKGCC